MGAFSARYRKYIRKAWNCTFRRVTFRACDTSFKQDVKDRLLAPVAARRPGLVRPASIGLEVISILLVLTTIWSGYTVVKSGLNLYVYGTCNKENSESCTLGAESCSVADPNPTFTQSLRTFDVIGAFRNEFVSLGDTIEAIPSRLRDWKAEDYLPANESYLETYSASKKTALEVIDPGCRFCRQLFQNIKKAHFADRYNLSYVAFPISTGNTYKFPNSLLVSQYLEALRLNPVADAKTPVDWQILDHIFTGKTTSGLSYQDYINGNDHADVVTLLNGWLAKAGMTPDQIANIATVAASDRVADIIKANHSLVIDKIDTVKIPTIIFDGRRHDGLVSVDGLSK
ncbi:MAG TPA: hypothetical protein VGC18_09520 [Lacisediminihabitans sp.]|uniref:DsbA family protein n=1 Tax=Lacisediminihabitans sp. TaxID=2787631 RepID=UPI002ED7B7FA